MDPFSYLSVLISIVLALGMTGVLQAFGRNAASALASPSLGWVHALWDPEHFLSLVVVLPGGFLTLAL